MIDALKRSLEKGKLAHAYLFVGPPGSGRTTAAVELAKGLNCDAGGGSGHESCGECPSCRKIAAGSHPDVRHIRPEGRGSRITIDAIREVQREISLKSYEGKRKIRIIEGADYLTEEAANCLLKTLEEPPGDSHIILLSENRDSLLPTIVSRCQRVNFSVPETGKARKVLIDKYGLEPEFAHFLVCFGEGGINRALELREEDACSGLDAKNRIMDSFISSGQSREEFIEGIAGCPREEIVRALDLILSWFRDVLVSKFGADMFINIDRSAEVREAGRSVSVDYLVDVIKAVRQTRKDIQAYANPKLALPVLAEKF